MVLTSFALLCDDVFVILSAYLVFLEESDLSECGFVVALCACQDVREALELVDSLKRLYLRGLRVVVAVDLIGKLIDEINDFLSARLRCFGRVVVKCFERSQQSAGNDSRYGI